MTLLQTYKNLPFAARLGVGGGLLAWGIIGLYMSDRAEEKFGFTPSEQDKAELDRLRPKIHVVEKGQIR